MSASFEDLSGFGSNDLGFPFNCRRHFGDWWGEWTCGVDW